MNVVCHIQDQMHREYLNSIFAFEDGAFSIFRDTDLGRFICSMVRHSDFPIEQKVNPDKAIYIRLPRTSAIPSLFTRFSYIHPDDQRKINDFLIATFNKDFIQYYFCRKEPGHETEGCDHEFHSHEKIDQQGGRSGATEKKSI
ncbi:hypothetical protein [Sphingobacterium daejeonense]|uniref:hypothetical protein n=1 Tax=Sphingobacterium daejeonense TaxID=371142 RepID=UPI0010C4C087|nr:hypothetical protein [Sphingobacterium daejeonense]VTQ01773.1 Uncharacterised protein [Sphingobacterium daejeonense]